MDRQFGIDVDPDVYITELLANTNGLSPIDAMQALIALYEAHYGIFDHLDGEKTKVRPLALVALHESEENSRTSSIHELVRLFVEKEIHKQTGITLTEFLAMPGEYINVIFDIVTDKSTKENKVADQILKNIKN